MNRVFSDGSVAARATRDAASTADPVQDFAVTDLAPRSPRSPLTSSDR